LCRREGLEPGILAIRVSELTLSVIELTLSVIELTLSVTELTLSVTELTLSVTELTLSVTELTLSVTELTLSVMELTLSVMELTLSMIKMTVTRQKIPSLGKANEMKTRAYFLWIKPHFFLLRWRRSAGSPLRTFDPAFLFGACFQDSIKTGYMRPEMTNNFSPK
jgi:hypothetical protein